MQQIGSSLRHPLVVMVIISAVLSGLSVALWLLPLGLFIAAWGVYQLATDRALPPAPPLPRITNPLFQAIVEEIDRSQREVERSIRAVSGPMAGVLSNVLEQTREMVAQAHHLAQRGELIDQYLKSNHPYALQQQIDQLGARLGSTSDVYTRHQLEETQRSLVSRQQQARDLTTYVERINAQLANIDATLDTILLQTVRLRTSDAVAVDALGGEVAQRIRDVRGDMDAFQRALDSAMQTL